MAKFRCPGQNTQNWRFDDIFEVQCPSCRRVLEFWKDEPVQVCKGCGNDVRNPRIDLGCATWCKYADQCLGIDVKAVREAAAPGAPEPVVSH
jgi:hypothetical protein